MAATAQSSLAEILLRLNAGLVSIIATFLDRDSKDGPGLDYKSLTDLSEVSRVQTIGVLRQLYQRLLSKQAPQAVPPDHHNKERQRRPKTTKSRHHASPKHTKIRHPTLARVMIENSSIPSQIALVRPSENPKKHRAQSHSRSSSEPRQPHLRPSPAASVPNLSTSPPPPPYFPSDPLPLQEKHASKQPRHYRSGASLNKPRIQLKHKQSTPLPSPLRNDHLLPVDHPTQKSPPTNLHDKRLRPETFYSIASARTGSTKLGEIPMHKWAEPWDYDAAEEANQKALASGWPVHVGEVAGGDDDKKTKVGCWKRLFGRRVKAS